MREPHKKRRKDQPWMKPGDWVWIAIIVALNVAGIAGWAEITG